MRDEDLNKF